MMSCCPRWAFDLDGALVGSVFADNDGDGWQSRDERGVGDVMVTLNGPIITSTLSGLNGAYALLDVPDGVYTLSVSAPSGFEAIPSRSITVTHDGVANVPLHAIDLIGGAVYEDWDGDTIHNADEPNYITPITVTLDGISQTLTVGGNFFFGDVSSGSHTLRADWPATSITTTTSSAIKFAGVEGNVIRGTLWYDENGDGQRQPWEIPLVNQTVSLDGITSTATTIEGRFIFNEVIDRHASDRGLAAERIEGCRSYGDGQWVAGPSGRVGCSARELSNLPADCQAIDCSCRRHGALRPMRCLQPGSGHRFLRALCWVAPTTGDGEFVPPPVPRHPLNEAWPLNLRRVPACSHRSRRYEWPPPIVQQ